jgi:hypothetical protein
MIKLYHSKYNSYFEVSQNHFSQKMTWLEAVDLCKTLEGNWRLPTLEEFQIMYGYFEQNQNVEISDEQYWSIDLVSNYESEQLLRMIGLAIVFDLKLGISIPWGASVTDKKPVILVSTIDH